MFLNTARLPSLMEEASTQHSCSSFTLSVWWLSAKLTPERPLSSSIGVRHYMSRTHIMLPPAGNRVSEPARGRVRGTTTALRLVNQAIRQRVVWVPIVRSITNLIHVRIHTASYNYG